MIELNNISSLLETKDNSSSVINYTNNTLKKQITDALLDKTYTNDFFLRIYEKNTPNYKEFNDIEMIYLYVHQEKDQDEDKNTKENTRKEYVRELLNVYLLFVNQRDYYGIPASNDGSVFVHLKEKQIRLYQQWLKTAPLGKGNKPYSVATISRKTTILKSFLGFLYKKEYIKEPIHKSFIAAKVGAKDRPNRSINKEEIIQLLEFYKDHPIVHGLLSLLITTGARIEEICTVKVSDLTYERNEKTNEANYWLEVNGKGNKKRSLLIHDNVFKAIVRYRKRRRLDTVLKPTDHSPLLPTAKGLAYKPNNLSMYITKHMNEAEVPFVQINNELKQQASEGRLPGNNKDKIRSISPHTLRHGFAIISAENDSDVFRIMQTLGHEKIETTMIYLENKQSKEQNVGRDWKDNDILGYI